MPPRAASSPTVDHVIGAFSRDGLNAALAATHRAGFGPQTRVFDVARGDVARQLERAGLRLSESDRPPADAVLIVVCAPGRTETVIQLFERLGAESVLFAARRGEEKTAAEQRAPTAPDIRLGGHAGSASET